MTLAAIVLAAGSSSRFGADKLSAPFDGEPLVYHVIRAARAAPVERVLAVCRPGLDTGDWPGSPPVERVEIESDALSASLKAGIAAAGDADGVFIFLGDMPLVPHDVAGRLANLLDRNFAVQPRHGDRPGHPVLLSRRAFPQIAALAGDEGAGKLLRARDDVAFIACESSGILYDIDTPDDLAQLDPDSGAG